MGISIATLRLTTKSVPPATASHVVSDVLNVEWTEFELWFAPFSQWGLQSSSRQLKFASQSNPPCLTALLYFQDMGTPRISNRTTINDAHKGEETLSNQARRSSTYCQRACPWANSEWQDRTIVPANRPQYQPLARAPKLRVMHLYSSPFAWKQRRPPSSGWTKILRWAFATSRVSCVICWLAMLSGAHWMTSDIRGKSIWLGSTVLAVTMLLELSTTRRGERPGARTTMAVLEYICLSCGMPLGTCAIKPASSSSWIRDRTISGWSWALFQLSLQSWSGTSSGSIPECCGHAGDGVSGSLTSKRTPWRRKSASGSRKNVAKRCHSFKRKGWPGEMSKRKSPGGQSRISSMSMVWAHPRREVGLCSLTVMQQ